MLNFIVNAHSGKGLGNKHLKKIIDFCYKRNIEYTVHLTSAPGHATRIAKALVENHSSTIVAVGGDGTFHEVLNGIPSFEHTALGFIPSGRGNDFATGEGIPLNPIKALEKIVEGKIKYIDYIKVGDKRCLNVAGTGLDIDVLKRVAGRNGKITYLSSLVYCLRHFDPYTLTVESNGVTKTYDCIMAGICNGKQFGGGIKLSPASVTDDGKLNVVVMRMPKNKKLLGALIKFVRGKHLKLDITEHFLCEKATVTSPDKFSVQLDGEIYDDLPFVCEVVKGGLKTFDMN